MMEGYDQYDQYDGFRPDEELFSDIVLYIRRSTTAVAPNVSRGEIST
jgi:hypothetical protein